MYYVYKNCDLIRRFKTRKHAVRMVKRLIHNSQQRYDMIELMTKKYLLFYW